MARVGYLCANYRKQMSVYQIKFGTDGWRAVIAEAYTVENLRRISRATAIWMKSKGMKSALIGHDCRFGGQIFLEETARILASEGIRVWAAKGFVSTPMVSLGVVHHQTDMGIVITASHNPPEYNGYKLKSSYGGPTTPAEIAEIEKCIPDHSGDEPGRLDSYSDLIQWIDLEDLYLQRVRDSFDLESIQKKSNLAYDAMYGAGQSVMKALFPNLKAFHCEWNPGFNGTAPEPITKNLQEIMTYLASHPDQYIGVANDGDADRVAMIDPGGKLIDSHHILLLLLRYLVEEKNMTGELAISFSVTNKMQRLADHYGLKTHITRIGFKYIAELMVQRDILVAGEESGGLAVKGHIPERDGIWIALTVLEYVARSGKTIQTLIQEIYDLVGSFYYDRLDLKLWPEQMDAVKSQLASGIRGQWGNFRTSKYEDLDGHKYYFDHDNWLMFRLSGTEPVLRIYAQGRDETECKAILDAAVKELNL